MKLLTNSIRRKFGSCPRAYQFAYSMLRRPAKDTEALAFGTLIHKALEAWWGTQKAWRRMAALEALEAEFNAGRCDAYQRATARALIDAYDKQYEHQELDTVAVEAAFEAPLLNPETGGVSKTWALSGKIDAIASETTTGRLVIIEHKTTSSDLEPTSDYWPRLAIDGQVSGYYLGAQALGHDVQDCIYDVIRKPSMKPRKATPEESRKYKKDGGLYAGQYETDETPDEWEVRLTLDIAERPDRYFARKRIARTESDMLDYLFDMWAVGKNIAEAERLQRFPRNPDSCSGYGTCEYFPVCSGMANIDDPVLYRTIETANPELAPA